MLSVRERAKRRAARVRYRLRRSGRLRLSVFRSNRHVYAQVIDDQKGVTLVSASTLEAAVRDDKTRSHTGRVEGARAVGTLLRARMLEAGVERVVFDRGPYRFHGVVKALADAALGRDGDPPDEAPTPEADTKEA